MSGAVSGWDRLGQDRAYIGERGRSSLARSIQTASNALFETITGAPPPGGQLVFIKPHDHGLNGGTPLARGSHWSFAARVQNQWTISIGSVSSTGSPIWYWFTRDYETALEANTKTPANMMLDIPWGLDSDSTAISGLPCYLEAKLRVYLPAAGGATSASFSFYNLETGSRSDVQTVSSFAASSILSFSQIPIKGGIRNRLILSARCDDTLDLNILGLNICSTRTATQPASTGSAIETAAKP